MPGSPCRRDEMARTVPVRVVCRDCDWTTSRACDEPFEMNRRIVEHFQETGHTIERAVAGGDARHTE